MKCYPQNTANNNVPDNVFLIAETSQMSGEIITTYYIDLRGNIFKVGDWSIDKPQPAYPFEICRLTGDTYKMINFRWNLWKENK
jgi:hypothetical protein